MAARKKAGGASKRGKTLADYPELVQQLDHAHSGRIDPASIASGSGRRLAWRCPKGPDHRWTAIVQSRTQGKGCPFCSGRRVSVTSSLAKLFPAVARELHPDKNGSLRATELKAGSHDTVWWRCANDPTHEWRARIVNRTSRGHGCPFCTARLKRGVVSLAESDPKLAREWHPTLNGALTPHDVGRGSHRKVWWLCRRRPDHVWQCSVASRGVNGNGCPLCSGQVTVRSNSLAARHPEVARQWFAARNGKLTPWDVAPHSRRRVWWRCRRGPDHHWQATVLHQTYARTSKHKGCPFCRGLRISATNSLAALRPDLAAQWHPKKNSITADQVTPGSQRRVWWKCPQGPDHEWQTPVARRASSGGGCPFCSHRRPSRAYCLAKIKPRLAQQWHPKKNGRLTPYDVLPDSGKPVWWQCVAGHSWQMSPANRCEGLRGCPYCRRRKHKVVARKVVREVVRFPR